MTDQSHAAPTCPECGSDVDHPGIALVGPFDARGPNGEPCEDSFHERRSSNAASGREGYWTGTFVHASDPEWIAEMLNRRYDALFRLWNEAPAHFKHIAEEGLRR